MGPIEFETPENVQLSYKPAGLGTRFLAWFVDNLLMWVSLFVLLLIVMCSGAISESLVRETFSPPSPTGDSGGPEEIGQYIAYFIGIWMLCWSLGSFFYYGLSELLFRGQTLGKRTSGLRVVKVDGFALDAVSILVRNVFRVVDHIPLLWIVPLLSARSQRLGDMVAGTLVVQDVTDSLVGPRDWLSGRSAADAEYRFDSGQLKKLRPQDVSAMERLLERWSEIPESRRDSLLSQIIPGLCQRLETDEPTGTDATSELRNRYRFLEDLLAAEYRRQDRQLG